MSKHVPQRQLGFPSDDAFAPAGSFARAALWPRPHASSCHAPHHTLWLRARDADGDGDGAGAVAAPAGPAFVQVLVARGSATLPLMEYTDSNTIIL